MLRAGQPDQSKLERDVLIAQNNFEFPGDNENRAKTKALCPIAAHVRKTNPRFSAIIDGTKTIETSRRIIRNGIPYGSEYDPNRQEKPDIGRGLLFACYQSSIEAGFSVIQGRWANDPRFESDQQTSEPGHDPIIGQLSTHDQDKKKQLRTILFDPTGKDSPELRFGPLVTLKGGEYFFVPSLAALSGELSNHKPSEPTV